VAVQHGPRGTAADAEGRYRLGGLAPGRVTLIASAVGYAAQAHTVTVHAGRTDTLDFVLMEAAFEGEGITVTATMQEQRVSESPVRVQIIQPQVFERVPTVNLMDAIENINGLRQQVDCGVCGTNSIRINGMDGPYTAVLIDGMPIMSSLAAVYGLNGISPSIIQQVEVVKGPMSTLYGSEALAGVVNVITKNPATAPSVSVHTFGTQDGEYAIDAALSRQRGRFAGLLSATVFDNRRFLDENRDGFSDLVLTRRAALFGKATRLGHLGLPVAGLAVKLYDEHRRGGVRDFVQDDRRHRGSDRVYGERIATRRFEATAFAGRPGGARLEAAFNVHHQDAHYGVTPYDARQSTAFVQAVRPTRAGPLALLTGAALRYNAYDDNTPATPAADHRFVPGVFAQAEADAAPGVRLLGGLRLDHEADYGAVLSPRASRRWRRGEHTTLRANVGTGFRVVNLFTEDHAAYTGARATVVLERLRPERSVSGTLSLQQIVPLGRDVLTLDADVFATRFSNRIEPDYSVEGEIRYRNLTGVAVTRGAALSAAHRFTTLPLRYNVGLTVLDAFRRDGAERSEVEFAPAFSGTAGVSVTAFGLDLDYTGTLTGPMPMPAYSESTRAAYRAATGALLRARSPAFAVHNVTATHHWHLHGGGQVQLYASVENLLDYRQSSPLVGYYDGVPGFGETFDTAYVYGPLHGRCLGLGLRVMMR
jgi:outer membrane receptor for ferrienterochelin and colicins